MRDSDAEPSVRNALSFDLEHWHSATLLADAVTDPIDRIEESVAIVLDLLRCHDCRATFFVVGEVAVEYPDLVRRIGEAGHELGSHGHTHTPLFDLSARAFVLELTRSTRAIREATGVKPVGFRAPNFSVTRRTVWALRILEEHGFRYDSSVFPMKTPMYGVLDAPLRPYRVAHDAPFSNTIARRSGIVEFPVSVADPLLRLPIAGGFYARLLPTEVLTLGIRRLNDRGVPANLYFHPWEFNPAVPIDLPSLAKRFVSFHGIETLEAKLERLLTTFEWGPISEVLEEEGYPAPVEAPLVSHRIET